MSSPGSAPEESGIGVESASPQSPTSSEESSENSEIMKRAAAKQLIERYYLQLTDGCGRHDCSNRYCASCKDFTFQSISRNQAAIHSIEMVKIKAQLCGDVPPTKVAKENVNVSKQDSSQPPQAQATTSKENSSKPSTSSESGAAKTLPVVETPFLTEEKLNTIISTCKEHGNWSHLIHTIGSIYSDPESLLLSFRKKIDLPDMPSKEELRAMEVDQDKDKDEKEDPEHAASESSSLCSSDSESSQASVKVRLKRDEISLDLDSLKRAYSELFGLPDQPFCASLNNALLSLSPSLERGLRLHRASDRDPNYINIFLIIMEIPVLHSPEFIEKATPLFCKAMGHLPLEAQEKLVRVWAGFSKSKLKEYVDSLQQTITVKVVMNQWSRNHLLNDDEGITGATKVLRLLYYASIVGGEMDSEDIIASEKLVNDAADDYLAELYQGAVGREPKERNTPWEDPLAKKLCVNPIDCRKPLIDWDDFVNEPLSDNIEMDRDYTNYKSDNEKFAFMTHPFVLTTAVKNLGMYYDNRIRMINERRTSLLQSLVHGAPSTPYLRLRIRRDHIIDDALVALEMAAMDNPLELKKQLYVEFEGEQGIDEGGVSKEFFQLVVEEIFNPDIGMFTSNEETHSYWFNPTSFENDGQFTLIGIVLGLAIYNNIILDVHFPMVVYRKLLGKKGTFRDLKTSHPILAQGLQDLLEYEGDVEETFMQTFRISYTDVFDSTLTHDLMDSGGDIPVNNQNRQKFVDMYADFLLNKCIEKQFRAFKRGFQMVTDESPLKMLFRPEEVEKLVCGSKDFDFYALEDATDYDGGFTPTSTTVRYFWDVVHELTEEQKKLLLQFTTGSDRVPVGGLSKLKLVIARNGPDSDRLPTSHTCFNVLLLPDYSTKEKLKERLLKAITHAKGFGML